MTIGAQRGRYGRNYGLHRGATSLVFAWYAPGIGTEVPSTSYGQYRPRNAGQSSQAFSLRNKTTGLPPLLRHPSYISPTLLPPSVSHTTRSTTTTPSPVSTRFVLTTLRHCSSSPVFVSRFSLAVPQFLAHNLCVAHSPHSTEVELFPLNLRQPSPHSPPRIFPVVCPLFDFESEFPRACRLQILSISSSP
ncbi:hypothetical protein FQN51_009233 [Onygenales sp. PD_10]|nr:hypothetical protein FQN51_009233 [Onygenales sp. PD_10]